MALTKETKPLQVNAWDTPKETWRYVTVPEEDPLGKGYPNISLNKDVFSAGKTYLVPPQVADYINDRIKVFNRSCVRLLQPNVDLKSIGEVNVGSANMNVLGHQAVPVDATRVQTT